MHWVSKGGYVVCVVAILAYGQGSDQQLEPLQAPEAGALGGTPPNPKLQRQRWVRHEELSELRHVLRRPLASPSCKVVTPGLLIAQGRSCLYTLGPKVGIIYRPGAIGLRGRY